MWCDWLSFWIKVHWTFDGSEDPTRDKLRHPVAKGSALFCQRGEWHLWRLGRIRAKSIHWNWKDFFHRKKRPFQDLRVRPRPERYIKSRFKERNLLWRFWFLGSLSPQKALSLKLVHPCLRCHEKFSEKFSECLLHNGTWNPWTHFCSHVQGGFFVSQPKSHQHESSQLSFPLWVLLCPGSFPSSFFLWNQNWFCN